jgi:methyl-accepting chemotaxis protein
LIKSFVETRDSYVAGSNRVIALGVVNQNAEAYALLQTEVRESQRAYFDVLDKLIDFQTKAVENGAKKASDDYNNARTLMIALSLIAAVLGIGIAVFITRSITAPMNEALEAANKIAAGDMSIKINADTTEETGQLKAAMAGMLETIKGMQAQLHMLLSRVPKTEN